MVAKAFADELGGYQAVGDTVPTVSEGEVHAVAAGPGADVGESVGGGDGGGAPGHFGGEGEMGKEMEEFFFELVDFSRREGTAGIWVARSRFGNAQQDAVVAGGTDMEVGGGGFADDAATRP